MIRAKNAQHEGRAEDVIDMAIAEPYYRSCEGLLPWAVLRFWHEVDALRASGKLAPKAALIPGRARLFGVGVSIPDLWRTRQALSDVEGFDLRLANPLLGVVWYAPGYISNSKC
eukprot:scaffold183256_cov30-Prasinocladus_malaysianus.AAC.1